VFASGDEADYWLVLTYGTTDPVASTGTGSPMRRIGSRRPSETEARTRSRIGRASTGDVRHPAVASCTRHDALHSASSGRHCQAGCQI
jgi:hypothetical protein